MSETVDQRRCKARNKRGEPCSGIVVGPDGYCSAHSGKQDMSALGRLGGRGGGLGARLKRGGGANVRDELRGIDPRKVRDAIERSLTGNNESARVGAIRLLADLEVYRPGADGCERCQERKLTVEQARDEFARLIAGAGGRPTDALLDELERLAWSIAAETLGRFRQHGLEEARAVYRELVEIGVITRAPHPELETPRRA